MSYELAQPLETNGMPTIALLRAREPARRFVLQDTVSHIGSGREMNIRVPGLADHVLTVSQRNDELLVVNQSDADVMVGNQPLSPREQHVWPRGETISLGSVGELWLDDEGSPTIASNDSRFGCEVSPDEPAHSTTTNPRSASPRRSRNWVYAAVGIVIASPWLCRIDWYPREHPDVNTRFYQLVTEARRVVDPVDSRLNRAVHLLRKGRLEEGWHNAERAANFYRELLRTVRPRQKRLSNSSNEVRLVRLENNLRHFADWRIRRLASKL